MDSGSLFNSAIAIVVTLGVLVAFHEFGHFLMAKLLRMGVKTFSVGFGPRVLGFRRGRTEYKIALVPLGGFVALVGESPEVEEEEGFAEHEFFNKRPAWQRLLVVFAGPLFNFILAVALFWVMALSLGDVRALPVVGNVTEGAPAAVAGLREGDRVLGVDGQPVALFDDMVRHVTASQGRTLRLDVERDGKPLQLDLAPAPTPGVTDLGQPTTIYRIGVSSHPRFTERVALGPVGALGKAWKDTAHIVGLTIRGLGMLVSGGASLRSVAGPIGIAEMVHESAKSGVWAVVGFMCFFSVNLAIFNLLPIPVLDGGHILFFAIEWLRGRPVNARFQEVTTKIGLGLLLALMGMALFNDVTREGSIMDEARRQHAEALQQAENMTAARNATNTTSPAAP